MSRNPLGGAECFETSWPWKGMWSTASASSDLMAILRIKVIYPARNLSKCNQEHKVYPYLLRVLTINRPN